jgi:hypothetical protein
MIRAHPTRYFNILTIDYIAATFYGLSGKLCLSCMRVSPEGAETLRLQNVVQPQLPCVERYKVRQSPTYKNVKLKGTLLVPQAIHPMPLTHKGAICPVISLVRGFVIMAVVVIKATCAYSVS